MPRMMSESEVADWLKLAPETLRTWRARGKGPAYSKLGDAVRYSEDDVKSYLEANRVDPARKAEGVQS